MFKPFDATTKELLEGYPGAWMAYLGLAPTLEYGGGERGWIGDSPFIFLDTTRARAVGWQPKLTIRQAVERTVQYLQEHRWLLEQR